MSSLSVKHKRELSDEIGKMLVDQLETQAVKDKVCTLVCDYAKRNKLRVDETELLKKIDWHVKVLFK
jgi:hypothetical protein